MSARGKLSGKQEAAIAALLSEPTHAAAAARAGVGEATIQRWLRLPGFQGAYRRARAVVLERATGLLLRACDKAVGTLVKQLGADRPADAIRAAEAVLDRAFKGTELLDLAGEVAELRADVEQIKHERDKPFPRDRKTAG